MDFQTVTIAGLCTLLGMCIAGLWWLFGVHRKANEAHDLASEAWDLIDKHWKSNEIHFDEKTAKQVELRLTGEIENLKKSVDKMDGKIDRLLERK